MSSPCRTLKLVDVEVVLGAEKLTDSGRVPRQSRGQVRSGANRKSDQKPGQMVFYLRAS